MLATTTVPNIVRGMVPVMLLGFNFFKQSHSVIIAAMLVGLVAFGLGIYSSLTIEETHARDLEFTEI